ncbi:MAG TPA: diaminopimelate epimerase [Candidatus Sulfotelmatobacter sp.]
MGPAVIPFVKASACGNDFLLIDYSSIDQLLTPADISAFTRRICDRHEGVGADGVEWMLPHTIADVEIRLINAGGSAAEISGNGTRCVAAYLCAERGKRTLNIQTGAGLKICTLTARSEAVYEFDTAMGEAEVGKELEIAIGSGKDKVRGVPVSMGNPHYVVLVAAFDENWREQGAEIQRDAQFKQGVNVEFVIVESQHDVQVRFFERGVGETQSSGTGSCACAVAAIATGKAQSPVKIHTPGGTQTVRWENDQVFLRGPALLVCRGEYLLGLKA